MSEVLVIGHRNPDTDAICSAIGYAEYNFAKRLGLPMAQLENKAGRYVAPDERTGQIALARSASRMPANLRVFLPDPDGEDAYPIVTYTWLICYKKYPDRIKFPIVSEAVDWPGVEGDKLREVSQAQREMIERFQPYHGKDLAQGTAQGQEPYHPLTMLRELTDFDKHRMLTAVAVPHGDALAVGPIAGAMMRSGNCQIMHADCGGLPIELGAEIWRAKLPDDAPKDEEELAGRIDSLVILTQAKNRPVIPLIDTLAATVSKIIRELESTF